MFETTNIATPRVPRHRIAITTDGAVSGADGADQLAAALRYATRMASQIEPILDIGRLQWLTALSGTAVTARLGHGAGEVLLTAEVEDRGTRQPTPVSVAAGGANTAIRKCLRRVRDDLYADWSAVMTWDKRIVGALLPEGSRSGSVDVGELLPEVGLRLQAVLASLDETSRETAVVLEYRGGSLLAAAIEGDVLFAFADKFDTEVAVPLIDKVRSVLAPHDLDLVWTWGESWTQR